MTFPYDAQANLGNDWVIDVLMLIAVAGLGSILCLIGIAIAKAIQLAQIRRDARTIEKNLRNLYYDPLNDELRRKYNERSATSNRS